MINISETSLYKAVKAAYVAIDLAPKSTDQDIYKEDTAIFIFPSGYQDPNLVSPKDDNLECVFAQEDLFPYNPSLKVAAESEYWTEKLITEKYLARAIAHLTNSPMSRSCLYNFWDNNDFNIANPKGNCITQIYLRKRGDQLEMHSHIRANDVHRCLFLDLAYLMYAHAVVANHLGLSKGTFVHFVDALHVYNKSLEEFKKQQYFMLNSPNKWASYE
jgi:hypothetical protein